MKKTKEHWHIVPFQKKQEKLNNALLIVGLPGIGNVGKIAVDFLIDELHAKKMYEITSYHFPHTVIVGDDNLIHMLKVELFYKKAEKQDLLLLTGDIQPTEQHACYEFCDLVLDLFADLSGKEVMTIGGIGLQEAQTTPKVFCTGTDEHIVTKYKKGTTMNPHLYGVVGPIMGVAGLLLGLCSQRNIPGISVLAETVAHPLYIGIKGSKEILLVLQKKLNLSFDINKLDKEIKAFDKELLKTMRQIQGQHPDALSAPGQQTYIG